MFFAVLFGIAFTAQIAVISVFYPRKLNFVAQLITSKSPRGEQAMATCHSIYAKVNYAIAMLGLPLLVICLNLQVRNVTTGLLLSIGLYFLLQISTITILVVNRVLPIQQLSYESRCPTDLEMDRGKVRFLAVAPPLPVLIAVGLYLAYLAFILSQLHQFDGHGMAKVVAITITNLLFAGTLLWSYRKLKVSAPEQAAERYAEFRRMSPIIIFGSILVTTYFFAKEVMFGLDLHELRPTVMSLFLQLVAISMFYVLCDANTNGRTTASV